MENSSFHGDFGRQIGAMADNPGQWLVHCHNIYHGELGMMTALSYVS